MPTVSRYVRTILAAIVLVYGSMLALAYLVEPRTRQMSVPLDAAVVRDAGRAGPAAEAANGH